MYIYIDIYITYKIEFFSLHNYVFYIIMFFMISYIGLLVFYIKLTNLAQKFKNLD